MRLEKAGLSLGKEISAWTKYGKSALATKPVKVNTEGLKLAPPLDHDVVHITANDYLTNIKKLKLNEKDTEILKNLLSSSTYDIESLAMGQKLFNRVINRADINLKELGKLFSGHEKERLYPTKRKVWANSALSSPEKLYTILARLEKSSLQPKDLEILTRCDEESLPIFFKKNILGEYVLPDKYIKNLSEISDTRIGESFSPELNRRIIEGWNKDKTFLTADRETGSLELLEYKGSKQIKTIRNINGNEVIYQVNPNNDKLKDIIKETICLKDLNGKPTKLITYEKSDIEGIFNIVEKDLKTGKNIPLSQVTVDSTGKKTAVQNLISPNGTNTKIRYEEMPNGSTYYKYVITDKNNKKLLDNIYSRTVINESEFIHKINDKNYHVKFFGTDKIEILDIKTKHQDVIDLKILLSQLTEKEKTEMTTMLKKVPANELLALNKYEINQLLMGEIENSSTLFGSGSIASTPNEFVFLHELGHQKDAINPPLSNIEKRCANAMHNIIKRAMSDEDIDCRTAKEVMNNESVEVGDLIDKISSSSVKTKISTNEDLLKIYNKERAAFIEKFGSDDKRISYFIYSGSGFGYQGEAIAEINALLNTPKSEKLMGTRSYLLAENFPETIAAANKLMF